MPHNLRSDKIITDLSKTISMVGCAMKQFLKLDIFDSYCESWLQNITKEKTTMHAITQVINRNQKTNHVSIISKCVTWFKTYSKNSFKCANISIFEIIDRISSRLKEVVLFKTTIANKLCILRYERSQSCYNCVVPEN